MSLPPGFLDELRTRISLSQVVGRKVMWDMRKSNQGKGDFWAPCPFHQEKSASFHVDDRKGFYYCFGCHAKGDALTFLRESENMSFMEAVEELAREAGMPMPARDPQAAQRADRRTQLAEVMEQAVQYYRLQLKTASASAAREYLERRRMRPETQERFEIGWAPDNRQGLWGHLTGKGIAPDLIIASGLAAKPDDGGAPYDRFRGRIIFPIRDGRGRAISLGGRSMDPNARAKYLNGPETELFDKGRNLYNHGPAREAAGKGQRLIVTEGYMDVIALVEAGFGAAVAPLGTAVTEDQLRLMWRIAPEPVIALDGDTAGLRAARRVIDLALPLLEAGQSLRFAVLPAGKDPDDLIKAEGAASMEAVIDSAMPMVQLLWQRETEGQVFDSPERRAALDKTLRQLISRIQDPSIKIHYGEAIKDLRWELFGSRRREGQSAQGERRSFTPGPRAPGGGRRGGPGAWPLPQLPPIASTKRSLLVGGDEAVTERLREAVILATLICHPALIHRFEAGFERLEMSTPDYRALQAAILRHADAENLKEILGRELPDALEMLFSLSHLQIAPPILNPDDTAGARQCLEEEMAKLHASRGVLREMKDAAEDLEGLADEGVTWRLSQAAQARNRAGRAMNDDASDLGEDSAALSKHLQSLIDAQIWVKKKG